MSLRPFMLGHIIWRSLAIRPRRTLNALAAFTVLAAVGTTLYTLHADVKSKLNREFNKLGPNVVVTAPVGGDFSPEQLAKLRSELKNGDQAVEMAFAVGEAQDGTRLVVTGASMPTLAKMNPAWKWEGSLPTVAGYRAAEHFRGRPVTLTFEGRSFDFAGYSVITTGSAEDSRLFMPLDQFAQWTHLRPNTVQIAVTGSADKVDAAMQRLRAALPEASVTPVRQVLDAEGRVLARTNSVFVFSALLIAVMVALSVFATHSANILERRRDFAVMKALGSGNAVINLVFVGESLLLGTVGALLGFAIGSAAAEWIGRVNFQAPVSLRMSALPLAFAATLGTALISAILPLATLHRIQPANMLKGD
jgi:putative ABC transport system permease protein